MNIVAVVTDRLQVDHMGCCEILRGTPSSRKEPAYEEILRLSSAMSAELLIRRISSWHLRNSGNIWTKTTSSM